MIGDDLWRWAWSLLDFCVVWVPPWDNHPPVTGEAIQSLKGWTSRCMATPTHPVGNAMTNKNDNIAYIYIYHIRIINGESWILLCWAWPMEWRRVILQQGFWSTTIHEWEHLLKKIEDSWVCQNKINHSLLPWYGERLVKTIKGWHEHWMVLLGYWVVTLVQSDWHHIPDSGKWMGLKQC